MSGKDLPVPWTKCVAINERSLRTPQAYKRRTLMQVLPPANAYTKYAHAYIVYCMRPDFDTFTYPPPLGSNFFCDNAFI